MKFCNPGPGALARCWPDDDGTWRRVKSKKQGTPRTEFWSSNGTRVFRGKNGRALTTLGRSGDYARRTEPSCGEILVIKAPVDMRNSLKPRLRGLCPLLCTTKQN